MNKLPMKSLILSLFLVFALFQNASAGTVPAVFDIPVHDAVASIDQKLRTIDAFLLVYVNTEGIEFTVPTTSSEIRIYSSKGVMVGHNNFYFENSTTGTVWVTLDALDMVEGEVFTMMFWNSVDKTEKELAVTWNATKSYSLYPLDCKYYYASDLFSETVTFKAPTKIIYDAVATIPQRVSSPDAFMIFGMDTTSVGFTLPTTSSELRIYSTKGELVGRNNFFYFAPPTGQISIAIDAINMTIGEDLVFKFWDSVKDIESELDIQWNAQKSKVLSGTLESKYTFASQLYAQTVTFKVPTKLVDVKDQTEIAIYPNPASEYILVSCSGNGAGRLVITNINGVVVKTVEFNQSAEAIRVDVADLSEGVYLVQLQQLGKLISKKIVVKH